MKKREKAVEEEKGEGHEAIPADRRVFKRKLIRKSTNRAFRAIRPQKSEGERGGDSLKRKGNGRKNSRLELKNAERRS